MPNPMVNRRAVMTMTLTGAGPGSPGFNPASIPGLMMWLKGDTLAGLADAAAVSQWDDSSGQGNHVVQATGANQPTKQTVTNNGKTFAVARSDGNDFLLKTSFAWSQEFSLFLVVKSSLSGGVYRTLDGDNTPRQFIFYFNGSTFNFTAFSPTPASFNDTQAATPTNWNVISGVRRATNVQAYVNGVSDGATATTGTPTTGTGTLAVGASAFGSNPFTGDVAAALFFNVALPDVHRQALQSYLGAEYGIAVS
jgi:Concanavalin A-like lectin/glucanases superfamily